MAKTGAEAFVDTNVLLRADFVNLTDHAAARALLLKMRRSGVQLWISRQVIREYLVQITRQGFLATPLTVKQAANHIHTFRKTFKIADETEAVTEKLLELIREFPSGGKQIHDANIVATMLVNGVDTLLTMNVEDMKRFASRITVVAPAAPPEKT